MTGIFISYRRDDAAGHAGRLFDRLKERFGAQSVFMDVEDIAPGMDFVRAIDRAVDSCDVVLAVIGPQWQNCTDESGRRRLDDPGDFVRLEIASALRRDKVLIPVLVHAARMPPQETLAPDIQALARRQAVTLSDAHWDSDVTRLMETLQQNLAPVKPELAQSSGARWAGVPKAAALALMLLLAAATLLWLGRMSMGSRGAQSTTDGSASPEAIPQLSRGADQQTSGEAALRASVAALDFGRLKVGKSNDLELRVSNPGHVDARIWRIGVVGEAQSDYTILQRCGMEQLPANSACELVVRFAPSESGPRPALLSVEYLSRASPLIVKLLGNGASESETLGAIPTR